MPQELGFLIPEAIGNLLTTEQKARRAYLFATARSTVLVL